MSDILAFPVCTRRMGADDVVGQPCKACGHTDLVHPSIKNPALATCALCDLIRARVSMEMHWPPARPSTEEVLGPVCTAQQVIVNYETGKQVDTKHCTLHREQHGIRHEVRDGIGRTLHLWMGPWEGTNDNLAG